MDVILPSLSQHYSVAEVKTARGQSMKRDQLIALAVNIHHSATALLQRFVSPAFDLVVRIWIGLVFFRSGLEKIKDWDATVFLFAEEYKLPLLSPKLAAALGTFNELALPILLFVGLASRLATLPLIVMTCVIQFVLGASNPAYDSMEHFYWLFLLGMILVRGPGLYSLDHFIVRRFAAPTTGPMLT
jgi:putative oxidoreductase